MVDSSPLQQATVQMRRGFYLVAFFSLFLNLLVLVSPLYMMQVFDRVLSSGRAETLLYLTVLAVGALAVLGALEALRHRVSSLIGMWMERHLSGVVIASSVGASLRGRNIGAQPLRDLAQLRAFFAGAGIYPLLDAPWVPVFVGVIWFMHPWLGMLAAASAVLLFALALANDLATRRPLREAGESQIAAQQQAEITARNAEVVHAMGMLPGLLDRWQRLQAGGLDAQQQALGRSGLIVGMSKFVRLAVQIGILGLGAYLALQHELSSGSMIAGSILLGRALAPVEQGIGTWKALLAARGCHRRLSTLLRDLPLRPEAMPLPPPRGELVVERLTFLSPTTQKPILRQVSFELEPGQALGIIGPSGAGKSTLCRVLVGIWQPNSGHVRLDAADTATWDPNDLGQYVGYLPQDVELFNGTVRDNIARMGEAEPQAIVEAAREAGVHEMVLHLPDGYETELGAYGAVLSGGQRQRIGLARALFGAPRLLVLDEPNASLDYDGEAALKQAVRDAKDGGATVIIVANKPSILSEVDKLLLLRDGKVEMFGGKDEIMRMVGGSESKPVRVAASSEAQPDNRLGRLVAAGRDRAAG